MNILILYTAKNKRNNWPVDIIYGVKSLSRTKYSLIHNDIDQFYFYTYEEKYLSIHVPFERELRSVLST